MSLHAGPSPHYVASPHQTYGLESEENQWTVSPTTPVDSTRLVPIPRPYTSDPQPEHQPSFASHNGGFMFVSPNPYQPPSPGSFQQVASPILSTATDQPLLDNALGYSQQPPFPNNNNHGQASSSLVLGQEKNPTSEPFHWWWWWEIASAVLSITSMCLVIAILFSVRDKPLSSWPLAIQPNSAIAILTTVGKAAMMVAIASCISQLKWRHMQQKARPLYDLQVFDDASRGPWGSLVMLTRFTLGSFLGWSLAIVTIAALGIEPSAQNILNFELHQVNLTNVTAEMAVAQNYFSKAFAQQNDQVEGTTVITRDLPRFQAAILNGISGQMLEPSFTCPPPAVNCTWPTFKSLGMCASFQDVTEGVNRNCSTPKGKWDFVKNCTYTDIPGWFVNRTIHDHDPVLGYQNADAANGLATKTQTLLSNFDVPSFATWKWLIIRHDDYLWPDLETPPWPRIFVANFSFCEKTYRGIERAAQNLNSPTQNTIGEISSQPLHVTFSKEDTEEVSNCQLNGNPCLQYTSADKSVMYNITTTLTRSLGAQIREILNRDGYAYLKGSSQAAGPPPATAMNVEYLLQDTPDLGTIVNGLADTLTNLIRNNETGDNLLATSIKGTAFGREQFVIVRWEWLILPLLETVLASVLLVICIIMTRSTKTGERLPQLKTSVIACFAYPTTGWNEEEMTFQGKQTTEKLEELSKGMTARFEPDEKGRWKFKRV
ncbi:Protein of unknown function (DUF3176) domain containing protein [Naviculisporaceae sp. PSN 640]